MGKKVYSLSGEEKKQYAGVYLLDVMINTPKTFPLLLTDNDQDLEPVLEWLLMKEYIAIRDKERYVPSEKGREVLKRFLSRYVEYLKVFDIYCAVDLAVGEFAFSSYYKFNDNAQWQDFLNDDRWDDLRLAVAEYKKLNPVEIVFMSFINENRFGANETGWQFDLLLGSIWDDILNICDTAISWEELGYEDDQGQVSAKEVIEDIIRQGTELMVELHKKEKEFGKQGPRKEEDDDDNGDGEEGVVERVVIEEQPVSYYYGYRDPFYVSPVWTTVWLL